MEQEVQGKERRLKLLEQDLDAAEDMATESQKKVKDLETENDDLKRENGKLKREIQELEGMS